MSVDLEERMKRIRLIISDVDGVLTDGRMGFDAEGRPLRLFNAKDGLGVALWRVAGGRLALVSGLANRAVEVVAEQWRCVECLTGARNKVQACREIAGRQSVSIEEVAFLGDDLIDLDAMEEVGLAVAVHDAADPVKQMAAFVTESKGGDGALRELIETLLRAKGELDETIHRYRERVRGGTA